MARAAKGLPPALVALALMACPGGPAAAADPKGYLDQAAITRLAQAIAAPPAAGSAQDQADRAASGQYRSLENTERWFLATTHAELRPPLGMQHFDCTLGFRLSTAETPQLTRLMTRILHDADGLAERVKARAHRPRPVADDPDRPACQRLTDAGRNSPSYPSGSAAVAAAYGEVMADLVPEQAQGLRDTAQQVALSRVICAMHYPHDVVVGQAVGRMVHHELVQDPAYQADLVAARGEIAAARALGLASPACAAERSALALPLPAAAQTLVQP